MDITDCVSSRGTMEYYENSQRTFDTYPKQMFPNKFQLAKAGLHYTGKSDMCQCFRCHIKLSSWERDDDAIKEHIGGGNGGDGGRRQQRTASLEEGPTEEGATEDGGGRGWRWQRTTAAKGSKGRQRRRVAVTEDDGGGGLRWWTAVADHGPG